MKIELDQIPAHEPAPEEIKTLKLIEALLKNGGKIIKGNEWINTPQGGHFLIKVQTGGQLHVFKSPISLPFIIGSDGPIR